MRLTRRGALAGAAGALALGPRAVHAQAPGDAAPLLTMMRAELATIVGFDTAVGTGLMRTRDELVVLRLRDQEQEQADTVRAALDDLGVTVPPAPRPETVGGLGEIADGPQALRAVIDLERASVAAYLDALPRLADRKLVRTAATIMAAEGRHLVVLRGLLGAERVPSAFETGAR